MITSANGLSFFISLNPLASHLKNFHEESVVSHWVDVPCTYIAQTVLFCMGWSMGEVHRHKSISLHRNLSVFSEITGLSLL